MTSKIKEFFLSAGDLQFIYDQVTFPTIKVVGYAPDGTPIYGYVDASETTHELGPIGSFDPTSVIYNNPLNPNDPRNGLPIYDSARDYHGLRNVAGDFNNLIQGQEAWGSANEKFLRLVSPDYSHYLHEVIDLGGVDTNSYAGHNVTISNESAHTIQSVDTPYGTINFITWTQDVTTTNSTVTVAYGHHQAVNTISTDSSSVTETDVMVQDGSGRHVGTAGTPGPTVTSHDVKLTGGELDTTTIVTFGRRVAGAAAHNFHGVTNGVTRRRLFRPVGQRRRLHAAHDHADGVVVLQPARLGARAPGPPTPQLMTSSVPMAW